MRWFPKSINHLIQSLRKLPGIGLKTAEKLAYHIIKMPKEEALKIANSIVEVKEKIRLCKKCFNLSEEDLCPICQDKSRDPTIVCVVEEPSNIIPIEKSNEFKGLYHILHGALSPLDGIGPEDLKIPELLERLKRDKVKEVIIATNMDVEGEATALYLAKNIKPLGIKVTRIAYGLPMGTNLDFIDEYTIAKAIEGRKEI